MRTAETKTPATTFSKNPSFFHSESGRDFFGRNGGADPFFKKQDSPSIQTKPSRLIKTDSTLNRTASDHASDPAATIQTKLTIGQPGDKYEQEADAMASQVVQRLGENESLQTSHDKLSDSLTPPIQTKCTSCEEEDKLQKKEDQKNLTAEKLQRKSIFESNEPPLEENVQRKCDGCEEEEKLQKKEDEEEDNLSLQRKSIFESNQPPLEENLQRKCDGCEEEEKLQKKEDEEEDLSLQQKSIFESNEPPLEENVQRKCAGCEEEEKVQKMAAGHEGEIPGLLTKPDQGSQANSSGLESQLSGSRGSGSPLPEATRSSMESAFNTDFSNVNIHTGSQASSMNKRLHAQAFTHGSDIYFNEGKFNPDTLEGKQLLAHELTHTIQQGASGIKRNIQTKSKDNVPDIQCLAPLVAVPLGIGARYVAGRIIRWGVDKLTEEPEETVSMAQLIKTVLLSMPVDIKGMAVFSPPSLIAEHIKAYAIIADLFNKYKYIFGFSEKTIKEYKNGPHIHLKYGNSGTQIIGRIRWDINSGTYQMGPYQMAISNPMFDFAKTRYVLGAEVNIKNSKISGIVGVTHDYELLPHILKVHFTDNPESFPFDFRLLEKAVLGDEAENAFMVVADGILNNGFVDLMYAGVVDIKNFHFIEAFMHINDKEDKREWVGELDLNVIGMQPFTLEIDRTPGGILSGINKEEKILLDKTFAKKGTDSDEEKGFGITSNIKATYLNGVLTIQGEASYNSRRSQGSLFLMVTDYKTAKEHAIQFLPEEIAAKAKEDEAPPNPSERLAFMGAGNLSFTLFDGDKETRALQTGKERRLFGEKPEPQPNKTLQADASFVVEPEGYITIAGQVKPKEKEFILFDKRKYEDELPLAKLRIASIPGPLTTSADFIFKLNLIFGAGIGPLTLSEIKAEGIYSNRPDTLSELELSGLIKLPGELFVKLEACVEVEGSLLGVFSVSLVKACIDAGIGVVGAVQARPTIQLILPTQATINSPPEYYIKGNFHFDTGGKIFLQFGDSLRINLTEEKKDPPSEWKYKNSRELAKKDFGSKDVEIPADHTLGSQEIPRVSFRQFMMDNLKDKLRNLILAERPRKRENAEKYFEPGKVTDDKGKTDTTGSKFSEGGFEEGLEEKGKLVDEHADDPTVLSADEPRAHFVFEEEFNMSGTPHTLFLIVNQTGNGDQAKVDTTLLMESEFEKLTEKIKEEKEEVISSDNSTKEIQKKDISVIESQAQKVKADAEKLGVNNELSNKSEVPGLKITSLSIQNYGNRYDKTDLGEKGDFIEPLCDKPKNVHPGDEIFFPGYTGGQDIGTVIEIVAYPHDHKGKRMSFWHIRYKPKTGRKKTSVAPRAFDDNCNPAYRIPETQEDCKVEIDHAEKKVPGRVVNKIQVKQRVKADWVKAYPLCWGIELKPKDELVGMDRISYLKQSKWHRTHLVHARLGGKGAYWNLIPAPYFVNNSKMPSQFETKLKGLVLDGIKKGKQYWFMAEVVYYKESDNPVVGHYDDFVKEIRIYYGEFIDMGNGNQEFKDAGSPKTTVKMDNLPSSNDLAPDRVKG